MISILSRRISRQPSVCIISHYLHYSKSDASIIIAGTNDFRIVTQIRIAHFHIFGIFSRSNRHRWPTSFVPAHAPPTPKYSTSQPRPPLIYQISDDSAFFPLSPPLFPRFKLVKFSCSAFIHGFRLALTPGG